MNASNELIRHLAIAELQASGMSESRARWAVNGAEPITTDEDINKQRYTRAAIREVLTREAQVAQEEADRANAILAEYRNALAKF